mgnify:CR=1 FL=1
MTREEIATEDAALAKAKITCTPATGGHDLEWVGQRGHEVLIWRCRKCGWEIS